MERGPTQHAPRLLALVASVALVCGVILAGCGVTASAGGSGQPGASGTPVAYDAHAGKILVQLFPSPGFIFPPVNGVPSWTLYGDGTLVFASGASTGGSKPLLEAKLTTAQIQHILDVVVNQNQFFASNKPSYGRAMPDTGATLLIVNAASQSKTVALYGDAGSQPDTQTKNVFAIESFLQGYHPANTQPYTPEGVAVLVYPASSGQNTLPVRAWPDPAVNLTQVELAECPFLQNEKMCPQRNVGATGILPIYGSSGTSLLSQLGAQSLVSQNGATYLVVIWPLMPDVPPPSAHPTSAPYPVPVIRVAASAQIHEWPLMTKNGVPVGA
ncbi:MAG: hypothetical protein ACRDHP_02150 [Ktedonobacterales bacterium]